MTRRHRERLRWTRGMTLGVALVVLVISVAAFTLLRTRGQDGANWTSGVWIGNDTTTAGVQKFVEYRQRDADVTLTYAAKETWQSMANSSFAVTNFEGYDGRLVYGLPLLPTKDKNPGTLAEVAAGKHDEVFTQIAKDLTDHDRGDSIIRVGLEANGTWDPWGATAETADDYKAAFRHVVELYRAATPDFEYVFDISCGTPLTGSSDRTAPLTDLYPGDDYVDIIGCDFYDVYQTRADSETTWVTASKTLPRAATLADLVTFAEQHDKPFAIPEWGLTARDQNGGGDNPFFIQAMHRFFRANADQLAFECYFNEAKTDIHSSLNAPNENPDSSEVYRQLWG